MLFLSGEVNRRLQRSSAPGGWATPQDRVIARPEYDFPEAGPRQYEQRPRVRRIGRDGKVTTLAIVGEK